MKPQMDEVSGVPAVMVSADQADAAGVEQERIDAEVREAAVRAVLTKGADIEANKILSRHRDTARVLVLELMAAAWIEVPAFSERTNTTYTHPPLPLTTKPQTLYDKIKHSLEPVKFG